MTKRLLALATAALAVIAIATGCGSDSDGETTETITKAAYVKQADAICLKHNEDTSDKYQAFNRKFFNQKRKSPNKAEQRKMTDSVYFANLEKRLSELEELPLPEEQEEEVAALIEAMQKGLSEAKKQKALAFVDTFNHFKQANKLAEDIGFKYCYEV